MRQLFFSLADHNTFTAVMHHCTDLPCVFKLVQQSKCIFDFLLWQSNNNPTPQLKVRYISWVLTSPACCSQLKTAGHCQLLPSIIACVLSGSTRGIFSQKPHRLCVQWRGYRYLRSALIHFNVNACWL